MRVETILNLRGEGESCNDSPALSTFITGLVKCPKGCVFVLLHVGAHCTEDYSSQLIMIDRI